MKELSIEEKAKAYDEAIKRAKTLYDNNQPISGSNVIINNIFPELKESEDERIRKEIYWFFTQPDTVCDERWIAWLEKQKAVDVLDAEEREFADNVNSYRKDMDEFYKKGYDAGREAEKQYWLEKQDGQKPQGKSALEAIKEEKVDNANKVEPKFKVGDFIQFNGIGHTRYTIKEVCGLSHYINTCNKRMDMSYTDANFELVEQNPADKVEPKFKVGDTIKDPYGDTYHIIEIGNDSYKTDDGRFVLFTNEEAYSLFNHAWSEEDENILEAITYTVKNSGYGHCIGVSIKVMIDWLKSLRPQNRWKPSEKQMEALKDACDEHWEPDGLDPLYTLYQELKKLREE